MNENIQMEKQCYTDAKARLTETPLVVPDENIYMYLGHGGDLCDKQGNLVVKTVPENCIYITGTVCGIINRLGDNSFKSFALAQNQNIWRDPIKYMNELKRVFGQAVHIHMPGCSYVDSIFYAVSEPSANRTNRNKTLELSYSGLMPLSSALAMTEDEKELFHHKAFQIDVANVLNESLVTSDIKKYFAKSVYPVVEYRQERMPAFLFRLLKENKYRRKVSDLLAEFPGIHFNFLCRSISDPLCRSSVLLRRTLSASVQDTLYPGIHKLINVRNTNTEGKLYEYVAYLRDKLIKDGNLQEIEYLLNRTEREFSDTHVLLEQIYKAILKGKVIEFHQTNRLDELPQFLETVPAEFLNDISLYLNEAQRSVPGGARRSRSRSRTRSRPRTRKSKSLKKKRT